MAYKDDLIKVASLDLPWEKLEGCNILVTGATGLIGSCLVEALLSRKEGHYQVYASGRNEERAKRRYMMSQNLYKVTLSFIILLMLQVMHLLTFLQRNL